MIEQADKLNNQAIILASDGEYSEAIACFKRAITLDKSNYLLWYNLGVTYRDLGELEKARGALETAYNLDPDNDDAEETFATLCLMQKDYEEVLAICETGLYRNPYNSHLWNLVGVTNFQNENYEDAATCFEQAVFINPYYLDALYNLRDTYDFLKNTKGITEIDIRIKEIEKS